MMDWRSRVECRVGEQRPVVVLVLQFSLSGVDVVIAEACDDEIVWEQPVLGRVSAPASAAGESKMAG